MCLVLLKSCHIYHNSLFLTFTEDPTELTLLINCKNQLVGGKQTNKPTTLYPTLQELSSQWIGVEGKPPQSEAQNRNTVGFLYGCAGFNISISQQIKLQNENKKNN